MQTAKTRSFSGAARPPQRDDLDVVILKLFRTKKGTSSWREIFPDDGPRARRIRSDKLKPITRKAGRAASAKSRKTGDFLVRVGYGTDSDHFYIPKALLRPDTSIYVRLKAGKFVRRHAQKTGKKSAKKRNTPKPSSLSDDDFVWAPVWRGEKPVDFSDMLLRTEGSFTNDDPAHRFLKDLDEVEGTLLGRHAMIVATPEKIDIQPPDDGAGLDFSGMDADEGDDFDQDEEDSLKFTYILFYPEEGKQCEVIGQKTANSQITIDDLVASETANASPRVLERLLDEAAWKDDEYAKAGSRLEYSIGKLNVAADAYAKSGSQASKMTLRNAAKVVLFNANGMEPSSSEEPNDEDPLTGAELTAARLKTSSFGFEGSSTMAAVIQTSIKLYKASRADHPDRGEIKRLGADLGIHCGNMGRSGAIGIVNAMELTELGREWAGRIPAGAEAGFIGSSAALLSFGSAARTTRKAIHSEKRFTRLNNLRDVISEERQRRACDDDFARLDLLLAYATGKMQRRKIRQWSSVAAGTVSGFGSVGLTVAAFAVANVFNPLGWTLIALGTVVGVGVIGYTLIRRVGIPGFALSKKKRRLQRESKGQPRKVDDFTHEVINLLERCSSNFESSTDLKIWRDIEKLEKGVSENETSMKIAVSRASFGGGEPEKKRIAELKADIEKRKQDIIEKKNELSDEIVVADCARKILEIFHVPLPPPYSEHRYKLFLWATDKRPASCDFSADARAFAAGLVKRHIKK